MSRRLLTSIGVLVAVIALVKFAPAFVAGQSSASGDPAPKKETAKKAGPAPRTPWGEPDLQGIWTDEYQTPLQRPARFANREFFTEEERAELDARRGAMIGRDRRGAARSERDVAGAYNAVFESVRPTGRRTSLVVDPPDGKIPPRTPDAEKRTETYRTFQLSLLQATVTCKNQEAGCRGGKYGPPSPRRAEISPVYNTDRLNRTDGPEDRSLPERCLQGGLPDFAGFRRIVQSPHSVAISYDTGQGQGWQRIVPVTALPHLPSHIRQWWGDSRGRWDGDTLVIDVANFTPKTEYQGSRENLHLVERWTRTDANTIEYAVTIDDPTTWTRPWTVKQELRRQPEQANRIYYEPRCHEGNYGLAGMHVNSRAEERDFAAGRGPDPATRDNATAGGGGGDRPEADPFQTAR
ncbi:MAG TPA: hypothetical protein VGQ10_03675 [Vicinamibacterales bacterium]|jgi:hypothetical protein|nr:hypothetical protein [Vicinamibacterales bacterium]